MPQENFPNFIVSPAQCVCHVLLHMEMICLLFASMAVVVTSAATAVMYIAWYYVVVLPLYVELCHQCIAAESVPTIFHHHCWTLTPLQSQGRITHPDVANIHRNG